MEIKNNPSFGAKVNVNYIQLRQLGDVAPAAADAIKPVLAKRSENIAFSISRAHVMNPKIKDRELATDMFKPTRKIIITAKKVDTNLRGVLRNLFRLQFPQSVSTYDFSKIGLRSAAMKAESAANKAESENIFAFILNVLKGPNDSTGPR